jgi:putative transposase
MTSRRYVKALQDFGIKQERMCYNNPNADAYIERWFRTREEETVWLQKYSSFLEAKKDIERYIQFYNEQRHSALGYLSPKEFRQLFLQMRLKCLVLGFIKSFSLKWIFAK